jgi:hypothetical protein
VPNQSTQFERLLQFYFSFHPASHLSHPPRSVKRQDGGISTVDKGKRRDISEDAAFLIQNVAERRRNKEAEKQRAEKKKRRNKKEEEKANNPRPSGSLPLQRGRQNVLGGFAHQHCFVQQHCLYSKHPQPILPTRVHVRATTTAL